MEVVLLVASGFCLLSALAWPGSTPFTAPAGAMTAVVASILTVPPGPLLLPVTLATGLVAAFGLATALGLLHPPAPHPR